MRLVWSLYWSDCHNVAPSGADAFHVFPYGTLHASVLYMTIVAYFVLPAKLAGSQADNRLQG